MASNSVSYKYAQKGLEQIKKTDCKLLGVVLNKVDMEDVYKRQEQLHQVQQQRRQDFQLMIL